MKVDVLLGLQWGDEGKGKIVDVLTPKYNVIARFQGGPNAGHTLEFNGIKHVLHTIPSGIFHKNQMNVIGNGVVIDPIILKDELEKLDTFNLDYVSNLFVSKKAHLILPTHRLLDAASEHAKGTAKIGSTLKGIGPTYMDKTGRNGIRIGDILSPDFKTKVDALIAKHVQMIERYNYPTDELQSKLTEWFNAIDFIKKLTFIESEHYLNNALKKNEAILAEGAQGSLLDIDFGSYPFVTSSNTVCAGACNGLGVAPTAIGEVYGIFKAYCTRVGSGPFPTELFDQDGKTMAKVGNEFGATTGRPRRCGWLDLPALKYTVMINGVTQLIMTKADVLSGFEKIKVCTGYNINGEVLDYLPYEILDESIEPVYKTFDGWAEDITALENIADIPSQLKAYIDYLEAELQVPITFVSVGPDRKQILTEQVLA